MSQASGFGIGQALELLDWRRQVFELYAEVRAAARPEDAWARWCAARDALFAEHPQTPLPAARRATFGPVPVFPYDPALRVLADVEPGDGSALVLPDSRGAARTFRRLGRASFALGGAPRQLALFWLDEYAGGIFLPFTDATSGTETYSAGRYLLDTAKGSDLGLVDGRLVLDFNFAYQPSCSYDDRWSCPLAPDENRLDCAIRAGERLAPPAS